LPGLFRAQGVVSVSGIVLSRRPGKTAGDKGQANNHDGTFQPLDHEGTVTDFCAAGEWKEYD
jgi:hypothetical protein